MWLVCKHGVIYIYIHIIILNQCRHIFIYSFNIYIYILFTGAHFFGKHMHANPTLPQHNHTTSQNAFAADLNARMFLQPFYHCQEATGWVKASGIFHVNTTVPISENNVAII